jgi:hypothetical protein
VTMTTASRAPRRSRWTVGSALVGFGVVMSTVVAPVVMPEAAPQAAAAEHQYTKCYIPIAGWLVQERPCESQKMLPAWLRKCLFAMGGSALVASAVGQPVFGAVAGAVVGCGGELMPG